MKTLVCGPYVGEFGWELFFWSGFCRRFSRQFDNTIMVTRPGRDFLYEDFATIHHYSPPNAGINDCQTNTAVTQQMMLDQVQPYFTNEMFWLKPFPNIYGAYQPHWLQHTFIDQLKGAIVPEYVNYKRSENIDRKTILIHARHRADIRPEDNPPLSLLTSLSNALLKEGYKVASIGAKGDSLLIDGTDDKRQVPLGELAVLMNKSVCTIGTTSGPLHFASLVKCPVITWQWDVDKMWYRFSASWNPLNGKLIYINTVRKDNCHIHPSLDTLLYAVNRIQEKGFHKLQIDNGMT